MFWITLGINGSIVVIASALFVAAQFGGRWKGRFASLQETACAILRIPTADESKTNFKVNLWARYELPRGDTESCPKCHKPILNVQNADRAVTYVERVIDRQINKVRGLLTVGAILIVAARTILKPENADPWSVFFGSEALVCLYIAIAVCLWLFFVRFGDVKHYKDFITEFDGTVELVRERSILIQLAVRLTLIGFVFFVAASYLEGKALSPDPIKPTNVCLPQTIFPACPPLPICQPDLGEINDQKIYFDVDSWIPKTRSAAALQSVRQWLLHNPTKRLTIRGYSAEKGTQYVMLPNSHVKRGITSQAARGRYHFYKILGQGASEQDLAKWGDGSLFRQD